MESKLLTTLPGTRDILPEEMPRWQLVEESARSLFARYGFHEIRTPLLEPTELFARGIGAETDIVGKEMYTFTDQSGRSVTLRPEATASVVRAYLEHHMERGAGVAKLYYLGPMFRHEKKQRGRWRQFYQVGAEVLGSEHPAIESEVVEMLLGLLAALGIEGRLLVNSVGCPACRPGYAAELRAAVVADLGGFCDDCRRRAVANPMRVLDCKVTGCQPLIERLPRITDRLCDPCRAHFGDFRRFLEEAGIGYEIVPRLVRGLDYYVRTAFEIVSGDLGAQNALAGGGRYDGLAEVLGGPSVPGFGFALGLDRLVMLLPESAGRHAAGIDVFIAHLGEPAFRRAQALARTLRAAGVRCLHGFGSGSLKSQLRLANRLEARHAVIVGDGEVASGRYPVRDMRQATQRELTLAEITQYLGAPVAAEPPPGHP